MKHQLAGIIGDRQRQGIHAVVDTITAKPAEGYLLQLMPPVNTPAQTLLIQKIDGFGGKTGERAYNEEGKAVDLGGADTFAWEPGSYQEFIPFYEKDLLMLAKLGSIGDRGVTGLSSGELDWCSRAASKLELRLKNRMNYLAMDALFNGQFVYKGRTLAFDVPAHISAGSDWSDTANATPFTDLYNVQVANANIMKYVVKEFVMNPKTAAYMMQSKEAKAVIANMNVKNLSVEELAKFIYPALAPIKVVKDAWQDETASGGRVTMGSTTYFVPDDRVLIVPDFGGSLYGLFGEIQIVENMNDPSATLAKPANGVYVFVDEKGLEHRKAPHVDVVAGFNGGANLIRSADTYVINV